MPQDSSEDRLLRLIKGKYKKKGDTEKPVPVEKKPFLGETAKNILLKSRVFTPSFFKVANRILVAVSVVLFIYLINSFLFNPYKDASVLIREKEIASPDTDRVSQEIPASARTENYSAYSKEITGRELFSVPAVKETEKKAPEVDVSKRFNLVGIIAGDRPQAIIEDAETKKTFYLYEGQMFSDVLLEEIGEGKVVLDYNGKKIILVL